jgi:HTH-type transcriptional regulator/antitoxin HigA
MIKRCWLEDTDTDLLEVQMSRFFKVANTSEIPHVSMVHAAKKTHYEDVPASQLAWLFRVRQIAKSMPLAPYSERKLREALIRMRNFLIDPEETRHVPRLLMEAGVRFVVVEGLVGSKIDGVCFCLNEQSPVIGVSTLHDRIDNFWFVLRHEIEHVLQRDGMEIEVIDVDLAKSMGDNSPSITEQKRIANVAAAEFCVPQKDMRSFIARKNPFFAKGMYWGSPSAPKCTRELSWDRYNIKLAAGICCGSIKSWSDNTFCREPSLMVGGRQRRYHFKGRVNGHEDRKTAASLA